MHDAHLQGMGGDASFPVRQLFSSASGRPFRLADLRHGVASNQTSNQTESNPGEFLARSGAALNVEDPAVRCIILSSSCPDSH